MACHTRIGDSGSASAADDREVARRWNKVIGERDRQSESGREYSNGAGFILFEGRTPGLGADRGEP
jgi:hypothetical protein